MKRKRTKKKKTSDDDNLFLLSKLLRLIPYLTYLKTS